MTTPTEERDNPRAVTTERTAWQRYGWIVRWLGTAAGIFYISRIVNLHDVEGAASKLSIGTLGLAIALVAANVVAGAQRWRVLLTAYGATTRPDLFRATQLYFVSFFYNNY